MSINIGTLDIGVAFAGDTAGLQKATADAQQGIDRFGATTSKAMRQVREDTQGVEDALGRLSQGFKGAVIGSSVAVGLIKLKNTAIEVGDALIQAQVQLDKLNNGFKFGAGGAAGGARELAFVREEANRLGLEIGGAATQYMKMVAAARGTNMEGEKTRQLFTAISEASTVMGMSGEQSERAMQAVVQMMSKGKVQAEELRGQLGEHLPGAFAIAARAMGVTEVELNKLMETGQVMSADFLPKFAAQLRNELGGSVEDATKSMQASLNRYETAWTTFKQNVAQTGVSEALGGQINILSDAFNGISERMEAARKSGGGFWSQTASGAAGVAQFLNPINALSYSAISLQGQLEQAKTKLNELEKERPYSGNIFLGPAIEETKQLIAELERAKAARDQLSRQPGTGASEVRYSAVAEAEYIKAQQAKGYAYAKLMGDMATPQEKFTAAVFAAKKDLVELYSPEVEARIRKNFIKPTHDGINALANQKAKLEDAKQYAINLQRELQDIMAGGTGEGAKLTESEKSAIKLQELLQTSIKGAARASTEKQLAVALETVSVEKANRAAERQIQIQKDVEKHRDSELRSLASEATAIQAKAAALNAELDVHGKSKAAIEAGVLARLRENAADVAMFSNSGDVVAAITAKIEAQTKYVAALKATDYKSFNEHTDELLRAAKEQQMLYQDELQLTGMTTLERNKIVAARSVELKYAKELSALDQSGLSVAEKETQRLKILEAKRIESAAAEGKAIQAEFERVSNEIEQTLTDALMRGFESGKGFAEVLRDTVANMFKTLVLRPIVSAIVNPVAGAITSSLGVGGGTGGNLLGTASSAYNAYSMYGALSNGTIGASIFGGSGMYASGLGMASSAAGSQAAMLAAQTGEFGAAGLAMTAEAAGTAATTAASAASATASASSAIAAAAPWLLGGVAVLSLLKSLDDSGTYHTGGLGSYSAAGGASVGDAVKTQGLGFDLAAKDYTASSQQAAAALAQSVVGMLDSTANTFGQQAGYYAATAFADDSSRSGAWGALMLKLGDQVLIDWKNGTDKWPGREFADGKAGAEQYAAAVAKDVRDYLVTQTPVWADDMLNALGDAPTIDQLAATVTQINATQAALITMGDAAQSFANFGEAASATLIKALGGAQSAVNLLGNYYANFYSDAERKAVTAKQLTASLGDLGISSLPKTRAEYRALIDATNAAGNTDLAASLIKLSGSFASITDDAGAAADAVTAAADAIAKAKAEAEKQQTAALAGLRTAIDAEKALVQVRIDVAQEAVNTLTNVFDVLRTNADALFGNVSSTADMSARAGQAYIDQSLAAYRSTGYLPTDSAALSKAIDAARGGIDNGQYGSTLEYDRAQLIMANQLTELGDGAKSQLSVAERQLAADQDALKDLDTTLKFWEQQVALAQGNLDATLTVTQAIEKLTALFDKSGNGQGGKTTGSGGGGGFTTGSGGVPANAKPFDEKDVFANIQAELNSKGIYAANWRWINGIGGGMAGYDRITDPGQIAQYNAIRDYGQQLYEGAGSGSDGAWAVYNEAIAHGVSSAEVATAFGMTPDQLQGYLDMYGIPSFAVGANRIPADGLAYLHKDEAVVPAAFNPALHFQPQWQGDGRRMQQLEADNAELRQAMKAQNALMERIAAAAEKQARMFASATNGGQAMKSNIGTEVVAL